MFNDDLNGYILLAIGAFMFCVGLTKFLASIVRF